MIVIAKHIEDISLNPLEYLLDYSGKEMTFKSKEEAVAFLLSKGVSKEETEGLYFLEAKYKRNRF